MRILVEREVKIEDSIRDFGINRVSKIAGVSHSYISRCLKGGVMSHRVWKKVKGALDEAESKVLSADQERVVKAVSKGDIKKPVYRKPKRGGY